MAEKNKNDDTATELRNGTVCEMCLGKGWLMRDSQDYYEPPYWGECPDCSGKGFNEYQEPEEGEE